MNDEHTDGLNRAIIVTGLAIPTKFEDISADSSWILQDFQKGEPAFFVEHIRCGVELADSQPDALLLFSGIQSRYEGEPLSEGQGYFLGAQHRNWFDRPHVRLRTSTEEFAMDSFQNLEFGICRFKECVGRYPAHVTIVSYAFKQARFELHREAIRFPKECFTFVGPNNPPRLKEAMSGEDAAIAEFVKYPYGTGGDLATKRQKRNPFRRQHGYCTSCPQLGELLQHSGSGFYRGTLPWD